MRSRISLVGFILVIFLLTSCSRTPHVKPAHRVVVLGFDGVDPGLVTRWLSSLPNIRALSRSGTVTALATTKPPESPVAWAVFATGSNPGKTGIYDFLKRDPASYLPEISLVTRIPGKFIFGFPFRRPKLINNRDGEPFYSIASRSAVKVAVIRMPLSFPAEPIGNGELLAGLGVPDVRGTWGTFFYYSTGLSDFETGDTEFGGKLVRVVADDRGHVMTSIEGPVDPTSSSARRVSVPLELDIRGEEHSVSIHLPAREQVVKEGHWSDWFSVSFPVTAFISLHAVTRFYVEEVAPEFRLYTTPLSFDAEHPDVPLSYPSDFSRRLAERDGLKKTLGWWHDTWALNEERIDEKVFLEDLYNNMSVAERMTLDVLDHDQPDLTVSVFTATDSVSHMFYRLLDPLHPRYDSALAQTYGNAIQLVYERMDRIIGAVLSRLSSADTLIVVSDHGFHTWRRGFNTNTWLVTNGYMTLRSPDARDTPQRLDNLFSNGSFFPNVDWSRTRAYALGLGQIYFNLKGREARGIVTPGVEGRTLADEIRRKLLAFHDPDTNIAPLEDVLFPQDVYHGPHLKDSADLQLAFRDGYRTSWQTALGAVPAGIVVANLKKWSGDHCASDDGDTKGVFFCNRLTLDNPAIIDIAPTVLSLLGLTAPQEMDGHALTFADKNSRAATLMYGRP